MDDIKNTQNKQEAKKEEEEQQGKKYDPTLLCNYCLLNQLKDVKRCQFLSSKSKDPQTFVEAMHDNNTELMNGLINHGFDINSTCPHPYLEEDSICGVCGMDKYDFGVI